MGFIRDFIQRSRARKEVSDAVKMVREAVKEYNEGNTFDIRIGPLSQDAFRQVKTLVDEISRKNPDIDIRESADSFEIISHGKVTRSINNSDRATA